MLLRMRFQKKTIRLVFRGSNGWVYHTTQNRPNSLFSISKMLTHTKWFGEAWGRVSRGSKQKNHTVRVMASMASQLESDMTRTNVAIDMAHCPIPFLQNHVVSLQTALGRSKQSVTRVWSFTPPSFTALSILKKISTWWGSSRRQQPNLRITLLGLLSSSYLCWKWRLKQPLCTIKRHEIPWNPIINMFPPTRTLLHAQHGTSTYLNKG